MSWNSWFNLDIKQMSEKNLPIGAKHSKLKGLLNSISIAGSDNPLVEVEYKGKQSNVALTTQGEGTLKIFGDLVLGTSTPCQQGHILMPTFSNMLEQSIRKYQNRTIEAAQVINELLDLAREMRES
jgi:type I restriction enzyme R subunit